MDNTNNILDKFSILSNEPLFKDELQEEALDAFNHKAYAETLYNLFTKNKPPLSVGLFGGWGIGKSTILFSLKNTIKSKNADIEPIYFNAWKYSGDSFRREFLLSVALQLKESTETITRLKEIYHSQLKKDELKSIKEQVRSILSNKLKLNAVEVTNVVISFSILALVSFVWWLIDHNKNVIAIPFIGAFITYVLNKQLPQIIEINSSGIVDPKMIFPEQFEEEFEKLVSKIKKPVLIIIDDFDRCHAGTINDILTSIKTFLKTNRTKNCYFLVALDDKAVTKILSQSNERYEDEELRKYFDVTVRVSPLDKSDLIDFANTIAKQTDLPSEVIQIGVLAKCDDVRKIKHFINTFKTKVNILKQRGERYIPDDFKLEDHLASLAKIIVIEELFPDVFSRAIREPQFLTKLENHVIIKTIDAEIEEVLTGNAALREFMESTVHIKIEHPELFTFLKVSNLQYRISRGTELYKAILAKNEKITEDVLQGLNEEDKSCLIDLLKNDMLDKADGIFLKNTTSFCLDILGRDYFNSGQKAALAPHLCTSFKKQALYNYDSGALFNVAILANDLKWLKIIADKIRDEVSSGAFIDDNLSAIINSYYSHNLFIKYPEERYDSRFNQVIDRAVSENNGKILSIIDRIKILEEPEIETGQPILPNAETMNKIINSIEISNDNERVSYNDLKTKIVFDRWDGKYAELFTAKMNEILTKYVSEITYSQMIKFVFTSIIAMPAWLNKQHAFVIGNNAMLFYQRCSDQSSKVDTIKVMLISANSAANQQEQIKLTEFILMQTQKLPAVSISAINDFMSSYKSQPFLADLQKRYIHYVWNNSVKNRLNNPDDRVRALFLWCAKINKFIEPDEFLNAVKVVCSAEGPLQSWHETIMKYSSMISKDTVSAMAEDLVAVIDTNNNEGHAKRCFELLVALLEKVDREKANQMTARLIGWLTHNNVMVRKLAILYLESVKKISDPGVFKTTLNNVTSSLCNVTLNEVTAYEESLKAVLKYNELWSEDEWDDLSKLIKRLLDLNNNVEIHSHGRMLLREMQSIPKKSVGDITAALIALATSASNSIDKSEAEELIMLQKKNLDKKMIKDFLSKKKQ